MERLFHAWLAVSSFFVRTEDEEGATAVEYGLMVALIAVVIMATVAALGTELNRLFQAVVTELQNVVTAN
ncbi:MAG: Flp family type IVb pilin [Actinobacteria bacterium]|nr:Flp family type IVb pilin [Actinomycetota bacterium]